jgi:ankyrin repeat protein
MQNKQDDKQDDGQNKQPTLDAFCYGDPDRRRREFSVLNHHDKSRLLHEAITCNLHPVIKMMIGEKADIESCDDYGIRVLPKCIARAGTSTRFIPIVRLLVESKANVNASDNRGWTLLHDALLTNANTQWLTSFLLDNGAAPSLTTRTYDGHMTPIELSISAHSRDYGLNAFMEACGLPPFLK